MSYQSMKFAEYTTERNARNGERYQVEYRFPNGYGASVVRGPYTYGGDAGLYELAVLNPDGELAYDTPITNDVLGWLTESDVDDVLGRIADLSASQIAYRNAAQAVEQAREELDRARFVVEQAELALSAALREYKEETTNGTEYHG